MVTGLVTSRDQKGQYRGINMPGLIISKTAGDTRSVMTSRDPKCQGHADIFGWKYFE